jgi:hypothetical protein
MVFLSFKLSRGLSRSECLKYRLQGVAYIALTTGVLARSDARQRFCASTIMMSTEEKSHRSRLSGGMSIQYCASSPSLMLRIDFPLWRALGRHDGPFNGTLEKRRSLLRGTMFPAHRVHVPYWAFSLEELVHQACACLSPIHVTAHADEDRDLACPLLKIKQQGQLMSTHLGSSEGDTHHGNAFLSGPLSGEDIQDGIIDQHNGTDERFGFEMLASETIAQERFGQREIQIRWYWSPQ